MRDAQKPHHISVTTFKVRPTSGKSRFFLCPHVDISLFSDVSSVALHYFPELDARSVALLIETHDSTTPSSKVGVHLRDAKLSATKAKTNIIGPYHAPGMHLSLLDVKYGHLYLSSSSQACVMYTVRPIPYIPQGSPRAHPRLRPSPRRQPSNVSHVNTPSPGLGLGLRAKPNGAIMKASISLLARIVTKLRGGVQ